MINVKHLKIYKVIEHENITTMLGIKILFVIPKVYHENLINNRLK